MKRALLIIISIAVVLLAACSRDATEEDAMPSLPAFATATGDTITLAKDQLQLTLMPEMGGRISALSYRGEAVIIGADDTDNPNGWGNVFWPSPQSNWGWPPLPAIDHEPYQVTATDTQVVLTSAREPRTQLVVKKRYGFADTDNALRIDYRITNAGDTSTTLAPWEITRVPPVGVAFFPRGETDFISGMFDPLPVTEDDGVVWYAMGDADAHGPNNHKLMTHGHEGWLAWLNHTTLMVKTFADVPAEFMAPGEGEIEIYTNSEHSYVELEQQGILTTLQAGESFEWTVNWLFAEVPAELREDREALLAHARALAAKAPVR